jgi:hypothetical protein
MLFVKRLLFTEPPWRIFDRGRGQIVDLQDRLIARVPKSGEIPFEEREANLHLITAAPEILAALLEAAYHLERAGTPLRQELYDLINRVRGPKFKPLVRGTPTQMPDAGSLSANPVEHPPTPESPKPTTDPTVLE